jgi:hypothetical protein
MKIIRIAITITCLLLSVSAGAWSQTADELIKLNLHARGGLNNLLGIKNIKLIGQIETNGVKMKMLYLKQMPDKIRFQIDNNNMPGATVFFADSGWIFDPSQGMSAPRYLTKQEIEQKKPLIEYLMVFFDDLLLNRKDDAFKVSYIGKDTLENKQFHKLLVMLKSGIIINYYIDARNYFDYYHKVFFPEINVAFDISLSNYANVEGINIPLTIESKIKNQSMTKVTIETIKINDDIGDEYFQMPNFK